LTGPEPRPNLTLIHGMTSDFFQNHPTLLLFPLTISLSWPIAAQTSISRVWVTDNHDGTYRNPILHADYSDPDVVRVGNDFYLVASSFNAAWSADSSFSGSRELEHRRPRFAKQPPFDMFSKSQHARTRTEVRPKRKLPE
jgi:hypothetical protein